MAVGTHALPSELLSTCTDGVLYCFAQWAYNITNGIFWVFMLLGFCIAIYIASSRLGSPRAFGFAAFVGMMGSMFFAVLQLMTWWIASVFILIGAVGFAVMIMSGK